MAAATDTVTQLNNLTTQVGQATTTLNSLESSQTTQEWLEWISLGLAVVGFLAGAYLLIFRRKKK